MSWINVNKSMVDAILGELWDQGHNPMIRAYTDNPKFIGSIHLGHDGFTIFKIKGRAVRDFDINTKGISFNSTFSGTPYFVDIPYGSISDILVEGRPDMSFRLEVDIPDDVPPESIIGVAADNAIPWVTPEANKGWTPMII